VKPRDALIPSTAHSEVAHVPPLSSLLSPLHGNEEGLGGAGGGGGGGSSRERRVEESRSQSRSKEPGAGAGWLRSPTSETDPRPPHARRD